MKMMAGQVPHHQHNGHRGAAERTAASGTHAHAHAHAHGAIPFVLAVPCALLGLLSRAAGVVSGHASVTLTESCTLPLACSSISTPPTRE